MATIPTPSITAEEAKEDVWVLHDPGYRREVEDGGTLLLYARAQSTRSYRLRREQHGYEVTAVGPEDMEVSFDSRYGRITEQQRRALDATLAKARCRNTLEIQG